MTRDRSSCRTFGALLRLLFFGGFVFSIFPSLLFAEDQLSSPADSDSLVVKLITVGPGDEVYSWWGHTALVVEDSAAGASYLYDYGQFTFDSENFLRNFAVGKLWFSVGRSPTRLALNFWASEIRDIRIQELNLAPEVEAEIFTKLEFDHRPENRIYLYDHYYDNCATRLRDIIDSAVDGQFLDEYSRVSDFTFRELSRQYSYFHPFMDRILMFLMSGRIDRAIPMYDEMFLPLQLEKLVEDFVYTAEDGTVTPLVKESTVYSAAPRRKPVREHPPSPMGYMIPLGAFLAGAALFLLRFQWREKPVLRTGYRAYTALLCFFFGIIGSVLFFMAFFTSHWYTYSNENLLFINPLLLTGLPFSIGAGGKRNRALWFHSVLFSLLSFACFILIFLKIAAGFDQANWDFLVLLMPLYIVLGPINLWIRISNRINI